MNFGTCKRKCYLKLLNPVLFILVKKILFVSEVKDNGKIDDLGLCLKIAKLSPVVG